MRDDGAGSMQQRASVDVKEKIPVGVACFMHRFAHAKAARKIAQHMHVAEALHDAALAFVHDIEARSKPKQHTNDGCDDETAGCKLGADRWE